MSIGQRLMNSCVGAKAADGAVLHHVGDPAMAHNLAGMIGPHGLTSTKVCHCEITLTDEEWNSAGSSDDERSENLLDEARGACQAKCHCNDCEPHLTTLNGVRTLSARGVVSDHTGHIINVADEP